MYRRHIFAAAEEVFAEHGFEAARVQDIARRAGLSMGTIYAIFPSKTDLWRELLRERGQEILELARANVARAASPEDALDALIETYTTYFVEHPNFLRMHLREGTAWVSSPSPENPVRTQHWKEIHALQAEVFRRGIEAGVFVREDPAFLAKTFSAMDQALLADWVERGMKDTRPRLVERFRAVVRRAFFRNPGEDSAGETASPPSSEA
ncbi:MAG: hypothetical protein KatS3mg076_3077 [Candidatus Binatia bacterium]|nr:MAG: hypothetical protein KatS3mg076_3077 [Candidatus Binatia bacterium]